MVHVLSLDVAQAQIQINRGIMSMAGKINKIIAITAVFCVALMFGDHKVVSPAYAGYNVSQNPSNAENASSMTCTLPCPYTCILCIFTGTTAVVTSGLQSAFDSMMDDAEENMWVENNSYPNRGIGRATDDMVQETYEALNRTEQDIAGWFRAWFHYDYRPSLQDWTNQYGTALMKRAYNYGTFLDAERNIANKRDHQILDFHSHRAYSDASQRTCAVGTVAEGIQRGRFFSRKMRRAREYEMIAYATNQDDAATSENYSEYEIQRFREYETLFCDEATNNGDAVCSATMPLPDADVKIVNTVFSPRTIDIHNDANLQVALRHLAENIAGQERNSPIEQTNMEESNGKEGMMQRRSAIARRAAARNVIDYIASQRMPGSDMEDYVAAIRGAAGVPAANISDNPSYQEVIRAITEEKFLSGSVDGLLPVSDVTTNHYGIGLMENEEAVQREKLVLSSLYLVRLRDYYELLERMALTLAVQTSVQLDRAPMPDSSADRPTGD